MKPPILSFAVFILMGVSASRQLLATRPYWQQDVGYEMNVRLDGDYRTLLGHLIFAYRNNSPDTLRELRFHAHYNAFWPGSPTHRRRRSRGNMTFETAPQADFGKFEVFNVRDEAGRVLNPQFNYSIFAISLNDPLAPGAELRLTMDFRSRIPGESFDLRSSIAHGQLRVAHWYPQVCVYDNHMGWVDNQFLGWGEAYGEFGTYDVYLNLPEPYIVGATGVLQNRDQMFPDSLLREIDLSKFSDWPWGAPPTEVHGDSSRTKTWHFHAKKVHDFAFVADPQFRIARSRCGQTDIWILARQEHASGWQDAAEVTGQGMEILEREIGPFPYPEFTVVDCFSGMEYPGIIFCGDRSPDYKLLLWHEMTHNYFMGALGSNQTDRPFMDEGFTTYWEIRIMEELLGFENLFDDHWGWWQVMDADRWQRGFRPYLQWQKSGYALPMHIEADQPSVWMQCRVSSYYKPVSMLFALQYLVGEEGIRRIMEDYYSNWKFRHPYEQDFFASAEGTLGHSLEWFYDSWVRGTKKLDYSLGRVRAKSPEMTAFRLRRRGDLLMPMKVKVYFADGGSTVYYIPIADETTPSDCEIRLPRWDQIRDPNPEYFFEVSSEREITGAELDPQGFLADANPLNNRSPWPKMKWEFDYPLQHSSPVDAYGLRWAPTAFYNAVDGLQIGGYLRGDYLDEWLKTDVALRLGALMGRLSGEAAFENPFPALGRGSSWGVSGYVHEGQRGGQVRLEHSEKRGFDQQPAWQGGIRWYVHELFDEAYAPDPAYWEPGVLSAWALNARSFRRFGRWRVSGSGWLESEAPGGVFDYTRAAVELSSSTGLGYGFTLNLRGYGGRASSGTPTQRWFGLGGGGPLERAGQRWLRAWGTLPPDWRTRVFGEGNLRGYSSLRFSGPAISSFQADVSFSIRPVERWVNALSLPSRFKPQLKTFLFCGVGEVGSSFSELNFSGLQAEFGAGFSLIFPSGKSLEIAFPFYVTQPPSDENRWAIRTVLGFSS